MIKDSEIRIGINIGKASREDRGITVYTRNILNEFAELGSDYRFVLLHYPESVPNDKFGIDNADLKSLPYTGNLNPWLTIVSEQILNPLQQNSLKLDVVWHPHNRSQFIVPVGYVCTVHDILPISQPTLADKYLDSFEKRMLYLSRVGSARHADSIITASEFSRHEIIEHLGVNADKVVTIPSGIDLKIFKPDKNHSNQERVTKLYALPDRYMLTTGSYAPHKNLPTLLKAYYQSELPKKNIGLVMVGPNDATGYRIGYNDLANYIQELGISDKVRLLSSVPLADLITLYSNAELFASTSLYEGFGFTPLEAMACGIPVVVSNTSAFPEICGDAALYSSPHDAVDFSSSFNALVGDTDLRKKLIYMGFWQVRKYDWKISAQKTLDVLCSVVRSNK